MCHGFKGGRADIDAFEAVMMRADHTKGALREIDHFFRQSGKTIIALTVREILDEETAEKLV